ncbi:hypothetical protein KKF55_01615, partial [Patescibacteria group bacterium]|nr:hypothetical protein [Patescibacteria group bacterium]
GFAVNLSNPSGGVAEGYPLVTLSAVLPDGTVFSDTSGGGRYDNMDMRVSTGKDGQYVTVDRPKTLEDKQALAHAALDAYINAERRGDTTLDYEGYYYAAQARVDAAIAAMYPDNETLTQQEEETIDDLVKVVVEMEVAGLGLNTQADIAKLMVGGIEVDEEKLVFGAELEAYLNEHMDTLLTKIETAFATAQLVQTGEGSILNIASVNPDFSGFEVKLLSDVVDNLIKNYLEALGESPDWWNGSSWDYIRLVSTILDHNPAIIRAVAAEAIPVIDPLPARPGLGNNETLEGWHDSLQETNKVLSWTPHSQEQCEGKMAILVLGNLQETDGLAEKGVGLAKVESDLTKAGYEILKFRVGHVAKVFSMHPDDVQQIFEQVLADRFANRGMFKDAPEVTGTVVGGYSWGVGAYMQALDKWNEITNGKEVPILASVNIDGVQLGFDSDKILRPVTERPEGNHPHFTIYQENGYSGIPQSMWHVLQAQAYLARFMPVDAYKAVIDAKDAMIEKVAHGSLPDVIRYDLGDFVLSMGTTKDHVSIDDEDDIRSAVYNFLYYELQQADAE